MSISPYSRRKGQPALEFMAMFALALLIFSGFYGFFAARQGAAVEQQRQQTAAAVADEISFELDLALVEGDGFSRTFTLRESIGGVTYNVTLGNGTVLVTYSNRTALASTAAKDVIGTAKPGKNRVKNQDGTINITQP